MKKMNFIILTAFFAFPIVALCGDIPKTSELGGAIDVSNWFYRKPVISKDQGVQRLELDLDVLSKMNDGGSDLRLVKDNRQIPFIFDSTQTLREIIPPVKNIEMKQASKRTIWQLDLPQKNLLISDVVCVSQDVLFKRNVSLYDQYLDDRGDKKRRRIFQGEWVRSLSTQTKEFQIPVPDRRVHRDVRLNGSEILFVVENADNEPLTLESFKVHYQAPSILYKDTSGENKWLYYGNKKVSSPQYDITQITDELQRSEKKQSTFGQEEIMRAAKWWSLSFESKDAQIAFWAVLGLITILLVGVIVKLLPEQGNSKSN